MTEQWLSNPDAVNNIKRLLTQMGIPLETRVARICSDLSRWLHPSGVFDSARVGASRLVYGDPHGDSALREVDHSVALQGFCNFGSECAISVECTALIECKHRDGLAVFGFPYQSHRAHRITHPIFCEFAFAEGMRTVHTNVPFLEGEPLCTIGLLDNMHRAPRITDEQLIYKAGASLYDCIRFQAEPIADPPFVHPIVDKLGLLTAFKEVVTEPTFSWWTDAQAWMRTKFTDETYTAFNAALEPEGLDILPSVMSFIPIVCVDARLYQVETSPNGDIQSITPCEFLVTSLRLPKWPGDFHAYIVQSMPEALVTVVDVEHLGAFLDRVAQWFRDLGVFLHTLDEGVADKIPLQMAFMQSVASALAKPKSYSDIWRV